MDQDNLIYFAYGSNMFSKRLQAKKRCPSAKPMGMTELRGHALKWHKQSKDGSGKCDIVEATGDPQAFVLGVLYEIAPEEKDALDRAEGLGHGYEEIDIKVLRDGALLTAKAYRATNVDPALKPYIWYRSLVVAGAREHELSPDYITRLEAVPACDDPDRARHEENMRLIDGERS